MGNNFPSWRHKAPPRGFMKIHVDAGVIQGRGGSAAAVCRDSDGFFLGSSALIIEGVDDPAILEAIACREGLSLAEDLGLQNMVIASDCQEVVKHIEEKSGGNYGGVVKEINSWQTSFSSRCFKFESRVSNFEPHKLARHAVKLVHGRHIWLGLPHDTSVIPVAIPTNE